ncbi:hypothetical protein I4U23_026101 [Adineta vaga]|nr:hypothetical protein I4U23_026101 [Adineta vaga]
MDDTDDFDKPIVEAKDDATLYLDCVRLLESGQVRRFENAVANFDIVQYELNDGPSKSLLFYAIERDDQVLTKLLLDMEVPLDKEYSIMVPVSASPTAELVQKTLNAYNLARELHHDDIADLIYRHQNLSPYDQRFFRVLQLNDVRRCDTFIHRLQNEKRQYDLATKGLFLAAQLGSVRLLDYFLSRWKINVDIEQKQEDGHSISALLTAITHKQNEAAKFLLFRDANPNVKGQYGNALVTALHYESQNDLLALLLDKNADLTTRHPDYPKLSLREYCVLTNRVKAKTELDAYIKRLVISGNYQRLKWLVDHGYQYINIQINPKRNAKQLAKERYFDKIVKLIDDVENTQMKTRIKMNF